MLTIKDLKNVLPDNFKMQVTQSTVDRYNALLTDPDTQEMMKENILNYTSVLSQGKFKLDDYINAVKYVSNKMLGMSNLDAFATTFPQRYQRYLTSGKPPEYVHAYVSAYNKNKLVNLVQEQVLVPAHVLNAGTFQKAINTLAEIMSDEDVSAKARVDAATSLLTALKPPEVKRMELNVTNTESPELSALKETLAKMANVQRTKIVEGESTTIKEAHLSLFEPNEETVDAE